MPHTTNAANSTTSAKQRRFSLIRIFNNNDENSTHKPESKPEPPVPSVPAHYRHSMVPNMETIHSDMLRERRKSLAALTDNYRSASLDLPQSNQSNTPRSLSGKTPTEMAEKMRQFDELLQKRRGSTIRISLTPTLLSETM